VFAGATFPYVSLDDLCAARHAGSMTIASLLEPITGQPGPAHLAHAGDWLQGRTLYGGASALVAYTMAARAFPGLPPLRAGQVAFVAPVGEEIALTAEIIRQGRNVTQVRSAIWSEGRIALSAFWLFAEGREANAAHPAAPPEDWPGPPEDSAEVTHSFAPSFVAKNFELRHGQTKGEDRGATVRRWARLTEAHDLDPVSKLVLMGDVMPPGAMRAMQRQGPISSINWSFNVLDPESRSRDGWYLAENASQHADAGYSSERLRMWDADGKQVLDGLQCVAVFG
jgi:acyl-CoA thioesterase